MVASRNNFSVAKIRVPICIPTYFHVLRYGEGEKEGNIPDTQLHAQLHVLNADYKSTGISFKLQGITRTTNSDWYYNRNQTAMKAALRKGDYHTLNVYFQRLSNDILGYCYFPQANPNKDTFTIDGCSVLSTTLPNGTTTNYNLGRTLTHEAGHWFGLFHTFQGGCNGGDYVDDTPAEASPAYGCPIGRDTCTDPGVDPVHNFMDYSYDQCK
ncbi:metalloprotease 1 [Trichophaea hybrida]|nr:metalloprotease 1 [Trichophaea hybrida]